MEAEGWRPRLNSQKGKEPWTDRTRMMLAMSGLPKPAPERHGQGIWRTTISPKRCSVRNEHKACMKN